MSAARVFRASVSVRVNTYTRAFLHILVKKMLVKTISLEHIVQRSARGDGPAVLKQSNRWIYVKYRVMTNKCIGVMGPWVRFYNQWWNTWSYMKSAIRKFLIFENIISSWLVSNKQGTWATLMISSEDMSQVWWKRAIIDEKLTCTANSYCQKILRKFTVT